VTVRHLHDLTVFVISSGEETGDDCIAALEAQDCTFRLEPVRGVAPMSAAFQSMPDRCRTPYFVQVDADMILKPDAIRKLYEAVHQSPCWVYRIAGTLYEEGFGIGGTVKCWKRSLFRFVSFHDCRTVDRELHNRLRWLGLRINRIDEVVGIHRPRHSNFSFYLKTKSDIEKWRYLRRPASRYALQLIDEILVGDNTCGHQLLGALLGALTGPHRLVRSKNTPLEKKRLDAVLELLGCARALTGCNLGGIRRDSLCTTFAHAFEDFRGSGTGKRGPLVKLIANIYAAKEGRDDSFVDNLLSIVDR